MHPNVWARALEQAASDFREEARRRRAVVSTDVAAEALEWAAADLERRAAILADPASERTPAEWAAEHGVSEQTVRNWCHLGQLEHRVVAGNFRIPASARRRVVG